LDDRPNETMVSKWYLQAYFTLATSRPVGMGIAYIPLSEIQAYVNMLPLIGTVDEFIRIIRALDLHFVSFQEAKRKAQKASANRSTKKPNNLRQGKGRHHG